MLAQSSDLAGLPKFVCPEWHPEADNPCCIVLHRNCNSIVLYGVVLLCVC